MSASVALKLTEWAFGVLFTRLSSLMTPLSFVFLGSQVYGSYTYGLVLVGLYAGAESCCAPLLGMRLTSEYFRKEMAIGLGLSSVAYGVIAVLGESGGVVAWLLAIFAGAGAATAPGVFRVSVANVVSADKVKQAFSAETTITMICAAAAPALVAFISFEFTPLTVFAGCSLFFALSVVLVLGLPEQKRRNSSQKRGSSERTARVRDLLGAWPIFFSAAIAMSIVSLIELLLPALLLEGGMDPAVSGMLLSLLAMASAAGALLYAVVRLPGSYLIHHGMAIAVMTISAVLYAFVDGLALSLVFLCIIGLSQAISLMARNLALRGELRPETQISGFAILYSLSGVGYGLAAGFSALALHVFPAQAALLIGLAVVAAASLSVLWVKNVRRHNCAEES